MSGTAGSCRLRPDADIVRDPQPDGRKDDCGCRIIDEVAEQHAGAHEYRDHGCGGNIVTQRNKPMRQSVSEPPVRALKRL